MFYQMKVFLKNLGCSLNQIIVQGKAKSFTKSEFKPNRMPNDFRNQDTIIESNVHTFIKTELNVTKFKLLS